MADERNSTPTEQARAIEYGKALDAEDGGYPVPDEKLAELGPGEFFADGDRFELVFRPGGGNYAGGDIVVAKMACGETAYWLPGLVARLLNEALRTPARQDEGVEALPFERMLADLLAIIHRDGGHRQAEVGIEQAWMEAMMLVPTYLVAHDESHTRPTPPEDEIGYQEGWKSIMQQFRSASAEIGPDAAHAAAQAELQRLFVPLSATPRNSELREALEEVVNLAECFDQGNPLPEGPSFDAWLARARAALSPEGDNHG